MDMFKPHEWLVVEDTYRPEANRFNETIFYLGNGYMGVRGTPEEGFGDASQSFRYTFVAPIYDLVKAGAWRVRYVKTASVMVKSIDWFPVYLTLDGSRFDPQRGTVSEYRRVLNMKEGTVVRSMIWEDDRGRKTQLEFARIVSLANRHVGAISIKITPLNYSGPAEIEYSLDGEGTAEQRQIDAGATDDDGAFICTETLTTRFQTATAMRAQLSENDEALAVDSSLVVQDKHVSRVAKLGLKEGTTYRFEKIVGVCTSRDNVAGDPKQRALQASKEALDLGFDQLLEQHKIAWARIWADGDIQIDGDAASQQGIRLCIFNMHQNYAGDDPLVNMAAKGLSGPGYGGLYWWDTEMYMMPFFIYTNPAKARNLALYRYKTIDGARNKARLMDYNGAMYPWVTIDGDEHSNDWEYGMFEQHVTSAVAYGVHHYVGSSGDVEFLWDFGAEIALETARFWASRVYFHPRRKKYVINGVTGPDEYAVNVNNNCYTNVMAQWNLQFGIDTAKQMQQQAPEKWEQLAARLNFEESELEQWAEIAEKMYIPFDEELGIHLQDDAFLDRDAIDLNSIPKENFPLLDRWVWEHVMKTQAIKQADIVLLMYLLGDQFTEDMKRANYDFYEPKTTHDSSLSPCMHCIMAAELNYADDAFRYYLRSARLDLDDVNGNADQGFHIANMAGSLLCVLAGFGGMRVNKGTLTFLPRLPKQWKSLAFKLQFQGRSINVTMMHDATTFELQGEPLSISVAGEAVDLKPGEAVKVVQ